MSAVDEDVKPRLTAEGKFALALILCEFTLFALFLAFGKPEIGLGVVISSAVLMIAIRAAWGLHERRWYWVAIATAATMQVPVILYIPWSNRAYRGTALTFFGFLDFFIVWGVIKLIEKTTKKA